MIIFRANENTYLMKFMLKTAEERREEPVNRSATDTSWKLHEFN